MSETTASESTAPKPCWLLYRSFSSKFKSKYGTGESWDFLVLEVDASAHAHEGAGLCARPKESDTSVLFVGSLS